MSSIHPLLSCARRWALGLLLSACGADLGAAAASDTAGDPSFGNGAEDEAADAGVGLDAAAAPGDGDDDQAHVRLLHALVNVGPVTACHDPDLVVDQPDSELDESDDGPLPPVLLGLSGQFGEVSDYAGLDPMGAGAITLHRVEPVDDAGVTLPSVDGGLPLDCTPETREAVLPLPFAARWIDPTEPPDLALQRIAATLRGGDTVTLLASGLALDGAVLDQRVQEAEGLYLFGHPDDPEGAAQAGRAARARLLAEHAALVIPSQQIPATEGVTLAFAHLVPDVPSASGESGALHLCAKADDAELGQLGSDQGATFAFRLRSQLELVVEPARSYTFRAFAAEAFDSEAKGCAATSLLPVAEFVVPARTLAAGKAYTLVALGAIAADELCAPTNMTALARGGCPSTSESLTAHLALIAD